ncbi:MAG TPA: cysteine dioxygenase family protein [Vicinamibacteria bacterium]|nr:cysteine dioxygenase family protein [Vicinamibacteria bacterium]
MKTIDDFASGLRAIPEREFTTERVEDYLRSTPVDPGSLAPYLRFTPTHYTRNLIDRTELYELMAICWDVGQSSRIHNHAGQSCWMAAPVGRLVVQNYEVAEADGKGYCRLQPADRHLMDAGRPQHVIPERPVHAVLNPVEHGERAVSLHVYSKPYDRCLVYSLEKNAVMEVPLFFDTEYGRPAPVAPPGRG